MMLLGASPTPWRSRCACAVSGKPLPRTSPARSQVPRKISASRSMGPLCHCGPSEAIAVTDVHPEPAGLPPPQRGVGAAARQQLLVRAFLDDPAAIEHDEPIHPA